VGREKRRRWLGCEVCGRRASRPREFVWLEQEGENRSHTPLRFASSAGGRPASANQRARSAETKTHSALYLRALCRGRASIHHEAMPVALHRRCSSAYTGSSCPLLTRTACQPCCAVTPRHTAHSRIPTSPAMSLPFAQTGLRDGLQWPQWITVTEARALWPALATAALLSDCQRVESPSIRDGLCV
jgi:hypothetical protein